MKRTSTYFPKPEEVTAQWRVMDATGQTLGRIARDISVALQGKDKPVYTPHTLTGDYVVVLNAGRVRGRNGNNRVGLTGQPLDISLGGPRTGEHLLNKEELRAGKGAAF